jgi:LytR cell envelope-related transcriptional attenuator
MATSTVRFVIIVAFVVAGAVLIAQFPDSSTSVLPTGSPNTPGPTGSPSPDGGGQAGNNGGGQESPAPVEGVRLAVYNGTTQTGLASETALKLEQRFGYKINPDTSILNTDAPVEQTALYFVTPEDKPAAEALAGNFFKKVDVRIAKLPADSQVPKGVQVAVYLGTDYANLG